jgi:hypothetical protein
MKAADKPPNRDKPEEGKANCYHVEVPDNVSPGNTFLAKVAGTEMNISAPANAKPGSTVFIEVDAGQRQEPSNQLPDAAPNTAVCLAVPDGL